MASSGSSIGTVWVNVKPSLDGVQSAIQKGIQGTGTNISSSLGKEITKSTAMGVAVGGAILSGIKAIASKATDAVRDRYHKQAHADASQQCEPHRCVDW